MPVSSNASPFIITPWSSRPGGEEEYIATHPKQFLAKLSSCQAVYATFQ